MEKKYKVLIAKHALKQLSKLDNLHREMIMNWIKKNLEGCENPRVHGKSLVGDKSGIWRYRVGDYRLLVELKDDEVLIILMEVGHRREVYN